MPEPSVGNDPRHVGVDDSTRIRMWYLRPTHLNIRRRRITRRSGWQRGCVATCPLACATPIAHGLSPYMGQPGTTSIATTTQSVAHHVATSCLNARRCLPATARQGVAADSALIPAPFQGCGLQRTIMTGACCKRWGRQQCAPYACNGAPVDEPSQLWLADQATPDEPES